MLGTEDALGMWPEVMKSGANDCAVNFVGTWIIDCLLHPECKSLRETAEKLLKLLLRLLPGSVSPTATGMINLLDTVYHTGRDNTASFMDTLKHILTGTSTPAKLDCRWGITELLRQCDQELNRLCAYQQGVQLREDMMSRELWMGYTLYRSYEIVLDLSQQCKDVRIFSPTDKEVVYYIISGCVKAKRLLVISNNYIEKTQLILDEIFRSLRSDSKDEMRVVVAQCMRILKENSGDEQALAFLYEELHKLVNPEKKQPMYAVCLKRAPSQEMYIKGSMSKSIYPMSELGLFMSDIRTRICKDIGMSGTEELMELLVANQIIGLDLPIKLVYEKVWWPHVFRKRNPEVEDISPVETAHPSQLEPMTVVYRLAGVDGEATENRVDTIPDAKAPEDPEKKYALATVFADPGLGDTRAGLEVMLEHLGHVLSLQKQRSIAERVLKLLSVAVKTRACRSRIIEVGGVDVLAEKLIEFLPCYETAEGHIVDTLILIVGDVVAEANACVTSPSMHSASRQTEYVQKIINWFEATCNKLIANKESIKGMSWNICDVDRARELHRRADTHPALLCPWKEGRHRLVGPILPHLDNKGELEPDGGEREQEATDHVPQLKSNRDSGERAGTRPAD